MNDLLKGMAFGAILIGIYLSVTKVTNELKMTVAYDRQAAALERIADAAERMDHRQGEIEWSFISRVSSGYPYPDLDCPGGAQ